jgi:hypothetical protein
MTDPCRSMCEMASRCSSRGKATRMLSSSCCCCCCCCSCSVALMLRGANAHSARGRQNEIDRAASSHQFTSMHLHESTALAMHERADERDGAAAAAGWLPLDAQERRAGEAHCSQRVSVSSLASLFSPCLCLCAVPVSLWCRLCAAVVASLRPVCCAPLALHPNTANGGTPTTLPLLRHSAGVCAIERAHTP